VADLSLTVALANQGLMPSLAAAEIPDGLLIQTATCLRLRFCSSLAINDDPIQHPVIHLNSGNRVGLALVAVRGIDFI
jgi:hypothetical protein